MANVITGLRIVCGLSLIFCPMFSKLFFALYTVCGLSDILDGLIARATKTESTFGARLDTAADTVFAVVVLIKLILSVHIPVWLIVCVICIAAIKCINIISAFVICGHYVSEHTVMNKLCGLILYAIPFCIGRIPWQFSALLCIIGCVCAAFAAIREGQYIRAGKEIK